MRGHRPFVFTGQLSVQGMLDTFPGNSLPPLQDEQGALCLFSGHEHLVLRAVVAPAYQVHLGLCIPEVEQLGACPFRPLMNLQGAGRWEQQLVRNKQRHTVLRISNLFAWLLKYLPYNLYIISNDGLLNSHTGSVFRRFGATCWLHLQGDWIWFRWLLN